MNAASRMTGVSARSLALAALALIAVTVTPALAAAVAPDGGATAGYVGKTGQGIVVRLGVEHSYGRRFVYRARMRCSDKTTFLDDYFTDIVSVSNRRFRSHVVSSRGAVVTTVTGKLSATHASGTIRIVERYSATPNAQGDTPLSRTGTIRCDSRVVHWSARAR